jgi:hypothetical protein
MNVSGANNQGFIQNLKGEVSVVRGALGGRKFKVGDEIHSLRGLVAKLNKIFDSGEITDVQAKVALDYILQLSIAPPPKDANLKWILQCRKTQDVYKEILTLAEKVYPKDQLPPDFTNRLAKAKLFRDFLHGQVGIEKKNLDAVHKIFDSNEDFSESDISNAAKIFDFTSKEKAKPAVVFLTELKNLYSLEQQMRLKRFVQFTHMRNPALSELKNLLQEFPISPLQNGILELQKPTCKIFQDYYLQDTAIVGGFERDQVSPFATLYIVSSNFSEERILRQVFKSYQDPHMQIAAYAEYGFFMNKLKKSDSENLRALAKTLEDYTNDELNPYRHFLMLEEALSSSTAEGAHKYRDIAREFLDTCLGICVNPLSRPQDWTSMVDFFKKMLEKYGIPQDQTTQVQVLRFCKKVMESLRQSYEYYDGFRLLLYGLNGMISDLGLTGLIFDLSLNTID